MKHSKYIILSLLILIIQLSAFSQNIAINEDGSQPHASAILDVQSTSKGFLTSRMNDPQMNAIASPVNSLMIYNTTTNCLHYYDGTNWQMLQTNECITVVDIEDNKYNAVKIGNQYWMSENLKSTKYADGTDISTVGTLQDNGVYGYVYGWNAVMNGASSSSATPSGVQGVCPDGWHVPSDAEWTALETTLGAANAGRKLKKYDNLWTQNSSHSNAGYNDDNASGFNALPGGFWSGAFGNQNGHAYFWTTTEVDGTHAKNFRLAYDVATLINETTALKTTAFSVRCVRD